MDELIRPTAEETRRRWKTLEEDLAHRLGGWLTIASGSKADKGDAKSYLYLGECKYRWACDANGFYMPLDLQWLETIWRHADRVKKIPILALEWGDGRRACLLKSEHYLQHIGEPVDSEERGYFVRTERIIYIPEFWSELYTTLALTSIEIPDFEWVMFPWEDLSYLRRSELKERDERGKKSLSELSGGPITLLHKALPNRSFPNRPKGVWKK